MSFLDYFSKQAKDYRRYRPQYPRELFECIAAQCQQKRVALDVATGSGQAAIALTEFFDHVIGIDGSQKQLDHAESHQHVEYYRATAEATGVASHSVDCITVAQALHWFQFDKFYEEVKRIIVPNGILAVWCYPLMQAEDQKINELILEFYKKETAPYWAPERHYIDNCYQSISIPFEEIETRSFIQKKEWNLVELVGYLGTWSSVQKYRKACGHDPITKFVDEKLLFAWGDPEKKHSFVFEFPLRLFHVMLDK